MRSSSAALLRLPAGAFERALNQIALDRGEIRRQVQTVCPENRRTAWPWSPAWSALPAADRRSSISRRPALSATARSIAFSSWRTLPGHGYAISARIAPCDICIACARRELLEEVLHQHRNVVAAIAQRRQLNRDHVQAVVEILAKRALGHHPRQLGIGRGDDAHVHLDRLVVADALELALLQRAQQLHLQRRAHRPDFVEEQRALVRLLESSLPRADGAGERAAHVAEQLGFEQRLGNRAAVERDEAMRRAAGCCDEWRAPRPPCRCRSRR